MANVRRSPDYWLRQPPGIAGVNWNNDLTTFLGLLVCPLDGTLVIRNLVDGKPFTINTAGTSIVAATASAPRSLKLGTTQSDLTVNLNRTIPATTAGKFTVAGHSVWNEGPNPWMRDTTGFNTIVLGTDFPNIATLGYFGSGGTNALTAAATTSASGAPYIGGWDGATVWLKTQNNTSSGANAAGPDRDISSWKLNHQWDGQGNQAFHSLGALWSQWIGQDALAEYLVNPWQMFSLGRGRRYYLKGAGGTTIFADFLIPLEALNSSKLDALLGVENTASPRFDTLVLLEDLATMRRDAALPLESLMSARNDVAAPLESLALARLDALVQAEDTATPRIDALIQAESLATVRDDLAAPVESSLTVRLDAALPIEALAVSRLDAAIGVEWTSTVNFTADTLIRLESTATPRLDAPIAVESLATARLDGALPLEILGAARLDALVQAEFTSTVNFLVDLLLPIEAKATLRLDTPIAAESRATVLFDAFVSAEAMATIAVNHPVVAESLRVALADIRTGVEWSATISSDLGLSIEFGGVSQLVTNGRRVLTGPVRLRIIAGPKRRPRSI